MTDALGYRSCRQHGRNHAPYFGYRIDLNCPICIRWPERRTDRQYVGDLRVFYGLERYPKQVAVGEQLTMEVAS